MSLRWLMGRSLHGCSWYLIMGSSTLQRRVSQIRMLTRQSMEGTAVAIAVVQGSEELHTHDASLSVVGQCKDLLCSAVKIT